MLPVQKNGPLSESGPSQSKTFNPKNNPDAVFNKPSLPSQDRIDCDEAQFQAQLAALREANRLAYARRSPWPFRASRPPLARKRT